MGLSMRAVLGIEAPERHSYRWFGAGAIVPQWAERFGVRTVGWWGMTETVSHGIVSDPWLPQRPLAIGQPAPEYENVAASEIERVIAEVPGVAEAAVVARPDVKLDEVPVAFVVAAGPDGDALPGQVIAACAAKLADFKVPHEVTVVAALPRSTISR